MDTMTARKELPDQQKAAMDGILGVLDPFFEIRDTMPLQYLKAFLLVARKEGLGVVDYAQQAGVSMSVMSRHLLDIGERSRHMEKGFGLVTYRSNPMELRKHEYYLTDKGRALAYRLARQWGKGA